MSLSIVIPTLNEQAHLGALLSQLRQQKKVALQIIVADGGSRDNTLHIAEQYDCIVCQCESGRAKQMNSGAKLAEGTFILFLHADSQFKDELVLYKAIQALDSQIAKESSSSIAGHFALRFLADKKEHRSAYHYYEGKTELNRTNTTNGDQGFLMLRAFFEELGGFDEGLPYLEDQKLAERIRKNGQWITLPGIVYSSARRFEEEGLARRMILSMIIMGLHDIGFEAFFREAPQLYRQQKQTGQLEIVPIFRLIDRLCLEAGLKETIINWYRVGAYSRDNTWQAFFLIDVILSRLLQRKIRSCLWAYDRVFEPLWNHALGNAIVACIMFSAINLLRVRYEIQWWREKKQPSLLSSLFQNR
jgi:rSAM/selenodomain-associated transferase 2